MENANLIAGWSLPALQHIDRSAFYNKESNGRLYEFQQSLI